MRFLTGFRKWTMAIVFLVVAVALLCAGFIPSDTWLDNVAEVMVAFMATNVGEHIISVGKRWVENKNAK